MVTWTGRFRAAWKRLEPCCLSCGNPGILDRERRKLGNFLFKHFQFILFLAALGFHCCMWAFSSCSVQGLFSSCSAQASHRSGFSCCGAWVLGARASVVATHRLSSCSSRVLEHRLSGCGVFHGMWNPPGPGIKPMSPALAGRFLSTKPPRKSREIVSFEGETTLACLHIPVSKIWKAAFGGDKEEMPQRTEFLSLQ